MIKLLRAYYAQFEHVALLKVTNESKGFIQNVIGFILQPTYIIYMYIHVVNLDNGVKWVIIMLRELMLQSTNGVGLNLPEGRTKKCQLII